MYQIAILECNKLDIKYFFDCFAGFQGKDFFLTEIINNSNCEMTCQIWKLLTPKHRAFFVQDNPWCECEK